MASAKAGERRPMPPAFLALLALTTAWTLARFYAAHTVGFGDSEALYACYALHPQPAYLDHPAMIALLSRFAGGGDVPNPRAAHELTTVIAALVPWALALAARGAGASWRGALWTAFAFACVPEIAVGLFAMTPDLLLAPLWIGALGCAAMGLRLPARDTRGAWLLAGAGVLAGAAMATKATGALLWGALIATYATKAARAHAKTIWPWVGIAAGAVVVIPIAVFEARAGWPMLRHRLVDSQSGAGVSLRNLGAIVGGQLAYLSPLYVVTAFLVARGVVRTRGRDAVSTLLFTTFAGPFAALVVLAAWSRVAEPHWLAPPLLALPVYLACNWESSGIGARLGRWTVGSGLALSAIVYAWVLVPSSAQLLPASFDPRFDLANELFGWPRAVELVERVMAAERARGDEDIVVVGPHWTICAQLHAALGRDMSVGCDTPIPDDFDTWHPRALWKRTDKVIFVTDNRFPKDDPSAHFPDRAQTLEWHVTVTRGGRTARVFTVSVLEKRPGA